MNATQQDSTRPSRRSSRRAAAAAAPPPPSQPSAPLGAAVLPGTGRDSRFRLASEPDDRGHPILENGRIVGHSEFFWEAFIDGVNVLAALKVSPRDFAFLLDALGGLALEHVEKIAIARLNEPEE